MPEPERGPINVDGNDLGINRGVQTGKDDVLRERRERLKELPVETPAQNRGGEQYVSRLCTEAFQAAPHAVGERKRHNGFNHSRHGPRPTIVDKGARRHRNRQQFFDQKGHPVSSRRETQHLVGHGGGVQTRADHVGDFTLIESGQLEDRGHASRPQGSSQVPSRGSLIGAQRAQTQHPLRGQVVGEVFDNRQRLRISPVEILQDEQTAPVTGHGPQEAQNRLSQRHDRVVQAAAPLDAPLRHQTPEDGSERRQLRRKPTTDTHRRAERLRERPIRDRGGGAYRPPPQKRQPTALGIRCHDLSEARLADPGLTQEKNHTAATVGGRCECFVERGQLAVPSDHVRGQHGSTGRSGSWAVVHGPMVAHRAISGPELSCR